MITNYLREDTNVCWLADRVEYIPMHLGRSVSQTAFPVSTAVAVLKHHLDKIRDKKHYDDAYDLGRDMAFESMHPILRTLMLKETEVIHLTRSVGVRPDVYPMADSYDIYWIAGLELVIAGADLGRVESFDMDVDSDEVTVKVGDMTLTLTVEDLFDPRYLARYVGNRYLEPDEPDTNEMYYRKEFYERSNEARICETEGDMEIMQEEDDESPL